MTDRAYSPPKVVFPHIQKTGGTTVSQWISRHYHYSQVLREASTWLELFEMSADALDDKRLICGHFGSAIWSIFGGRNGFRAIALLRDPTDQVVSHFWHLKHAPDAGRGLAFVRESSFTLLDFLKHPKTQHLVSNYQTANYSATPEQVRSGFVTHPGNPEMAPVDVGVAKDFVDRCDVVGVTDNLSGFVLALGERFGFFPDAELHRTRSYKRDETIDAESKRLIQELNELDFELYRHAVSRTNESAKAHSVGPATNPNQADRDGVIHWCAGDPFWGCGWSEFVRSELGDHIWSVSTNASIQISVTTGERHFLVFELLRFVAPVQGKFFSINCNGTEIAPVLIPRGQKGSPMMFAASLGVAERSELTIEFKVNRLVGFGEPLANGPEVERRGLALCSVHLLPGN